MENAKRVIKAVTDSVSQKSSSKKDEITVMKAIMNDSQYSVDVYGKEGKIGVYKPGEDFRKVVANAIADTVKIPRKEASELLENYDFSKSDASSMVNFSKEFINTYLHTGRKLLLGGRDTSNIELEWKNVRDKISSTPVKQEDGSRVRVDKFIPAHGGIKATNPCPEWVYDKWKKENTK